MQCDAKAKSTGKRCAQKAVPGLKKCRYHGAGTKAAKAKSRRIQAEKKIMTELERSALTGKALVGTTNPLDELQKLTTELIHFKDQLTQRVNDLKEDIGSVDDKGAEQIAAEVDIYLKVIASLTKTLDIALKHDIEGKKLAIEQAKAEMVAAALFRVLAAIGITPAQMDTAKLLMHDELTKLATE